MEPPPPQPSPRRRLTSASLSGLLPHGGRIEEGGTARAAPARTGQRPTRCATATAPRASRRRGPIGRPVSVSLSFPSPDLLPHGGRIEEGGTARAAPARTGQRPARCATATAPRASRGRGPLAGPRLLASAPPFGLLPLPRLASSLTEGGLRRGEPLARPPRGQDNGPPAAPPLLRHGRAVVVDH